MSTFAADVVADRPARRAPAATLLWNVYDVTLAGLVILVSTDTFNRFGLGSPVWGLCYVMAVGRLVSAPRFMAWAFRANLTQFAYPAACLASSVWSKAPAWSFGSALQLLATVVIALVVGARTRMMTLILLMFCVLLVPLALSLLNWRTGVFGEVYAGSGGLLGIYTQKNMLGQNALFVLLAGVALSLVGAWRSLLGCLLLAVGMGIAALALKLSQSVTPILMLPVAVGLLLTLCLRRLNSQLIVLAAMLLFFAFAAGPLYLAIAGIDPIEEVLAAFGKNTTLTGRTRIWSFGLQVLQDHWGLGVGFLAFWRSAEFASYATIIQAIGGENVRAFHNFLLEIWIGTGIPGLVTMLVLLWAALWRTWAAYRASRSVAAAFALVVVVVSILLCLPGTGLYRQHESLLMFVVMFGASALVSMQQGRRAGQA